MADYDVFNGDADGICSLIQLRLAEPRDTILVSGIKRDIKLLKKVPFSEGDKITVLDISLIQNLDSLTRALESKASVFYVDHHKSGEIPHSPYLESHINLSSEVCTALIVDKYLGGQYRSWAITAAFGDNLQKEAIQIAQKEGYSEQQIQLMEDLGTYVNYNGYGGSLDDLFFHPADLYRIMSSYQTPFEFVEGRPNVYETLKLGYESDMSYAKKVSCLRENQQVAMFELPNQKWSRRVSGVYSNFLANQNPNRAHAVLLRIDNSRYQVSIRAPKNNLFGAVEIASEFPTGGGRAGAAGINSFEEEHVDKLFQLISDKYLL